MNQDTAQRARQRTRAAMWPLDWNEGPREEEAWPDKLAVAVRGVVTWPDGVSFHAYLKDIAREGRFGTAPTVGRKYRTALAFGNVKGLVTVKMEAGARADERVGGRASISLSLFLNPTRTRAHVVRRHGSVPLSDLTLKQFFAPHATTGEVFREDHPDAGDDRDALDANDNFFWNAREAGGTSHASRRKVRDEFLAIYERRLRELVASMFLPTCIPQPIDLDDLGDGRDKVLVEFDWANLSLSYAEIYIERGVDDPVRIVRRIQDRGMALARSVRSANFSSKAAAFFVEANEGWPHLAVPLVGARNIDLSIYAKTSKRVRFEVRYHNQFSRVIAGSSHGDDRLQSALHLLIGDAVKRLPWASLRSVSKIPPSVDVADISDLIIAIHSACHVQPNHFAHIAHWLTLTGGVFVDEDAHPGISKVINQLVKSGHVERVKLQQKERRKLRRFSLTERYHQTRRRMLTGFFPEDHSVEEDNSALANGSIDEPLPARLSGIRRVARDYNTLAKLRRLGLEE
jgi:hypothetical protein